jgi:hypothetical protein
VSTTPVLGDLYVDGQRVGVSFTPGGLRLAAGHHRIRVTRDGYQPYEHEFDLPAGDTVHLTRISLRPKTP